MKKEIVFATNNAHKLKEVSPLLSNKFSVLSLRDINCFDNIPETADSLEGNAILKAQYVIEKFGKDCFSDDTGLEVKALNNAPGVYSARYAGESKDAEDNMNKLIAEMKGVKNRKAQFRTVIALILNGEKYIFEGIIKGEITEKKRGEKGFGYDPIFIPEGYNQTFAELPLSEKNKISHRARAVQKLILFLENID